MEEFIKLAKRRKTTYDFSDEEISPKDIEIILEAGRWSPSCTNSQPWNFILIKDKIVIDKLVRTANYGDFHSNPSFIIAVVLLADKCSGENLSCFRGKNTGIYDSYMSCGMAALQMILEATSLNIDSCLLTPEQDKVIKILKVKPKDRVPILVGLGYEKEGAFQKKRERESIKEIVSYGYFGKKEL